MSNMRYTAEDLRQITERIWRRVMGAIRRVAVELSDTGAWRVQGYEKLSERFRAENYQGVGFASRPASGAKVDAVSVNIGNAEHAALVATRDESLRQLADLDEDETATLNTQTIVKHTGGFVEIRSHGGVAQFAALKADIDATNAKLNELIAMFVAHFHSGGTGGGGFTGVPTDVSIDPAEPADGTTVAKFE